MRRWLCYDKNLANKIQFITTNPRPRLNSAVHWLNPVSLPAGTKGLAHNTSTISWLTGTLIDIVTILTSRHTASGSVFVNTYQYNRSDINTVLSYSYIKMPESDVWKPLSLQLHDSVHWTTETHAWSMQFTCCLVLFEPALLIGSDWISVPIHSKHQHRKCRLSSYKRDVHLFRQQHSRRLCASAALAAKSSKRLMFVRGRVVLEILMFHLDFVDFWLCSLRF